MSGEDSEAKTDTIYRDVYLRRARDLLSPTLDESGYRAVASMQKELDELVRHIRSAVVQFDWENAAELSAQGDRMRKAIDAQAGIALNRGRTVSCQADASEDRT